MIYWSFGGVLAELWLSPGEAQTEPRIQAVVLIPFKITNA
jgi:hypothetical protein